MRVGDQADQRPRVRSSASVGIAGCSGTEPWRSVTLVNDTTQVSARDEAGHRQVFHHYLPNRRRQTRGVTVFAPMADTADHWDDLQFANLVAAKIQSLLHDPPRNGRRGPDLAVCRRRGP